MIFVDSDVLIAHLRNDPAARDTLDRLATSGETLAITSVNVAELYRGAESSDRREAALGGVLLLLDSLIEVPFGPRTARRFGTVMAALRRAGRPIPEMDGLIAAVVLENGGRLLTRNIRHFSAIHGLELLEEGPT